MNDNYSISKRVVRTAIAVLASGLLIGGAAWRTIAADGQTTAHVATVTTPIMHAVAGGRDSYADVVQVVAPAVVTIRTQGKSRVSPTDFQGGDDFFRRFFGDQFGEQFGGRPNTPNGPNMPRMPRSPRQRALGSGVIVSGDGYILTNFHVIDGADDV